MAHWQKGGNELKIWNLLWMAVMVLAIVTVGSCGCDFSMGREMVFVSMPHNLSEASQISDWFTDTVGENKIVIVKPSPADSFDLRAFEKGAYDDAQEAIFRHLKHKGANKKIGIWVPFPEPNNVIWDRGHTSPAEFAAAYNHYARLFKKHFPNGRLGVLVDTATQTSPRQYSRIPLDPYLKDLE